VPFAERGPRTEEAIRAIRSLWKGEPEAFHGCYFDWEPLHSNPKPVQQPGVPIVVGGNVEGAARRAARVGDGFYPASGSMKTLPGLLDALRDECAKIGRDPAEIELTVAAGVPDPGRVRQYQELGERRMMLNPPAFDAEGIRRGLNEFADQVFARVS